MIVADRLIIFIHFFFFRFFEIIYLLFLKLLFSLMASKAGYSIINNDEYTTNKTQVMIIILYLEIFIYLEGKKKDKR